MVLLQKKIGRDILCLSTTMNINRVFKTKKSKIIINVDDFNLLIKKVEFCSVFFLEMFSSDAVYLFSDRND